MFKLTDKKKITLLRLDLLPNWPYGPFCLSHGVERVKFLSAEMGLHVIVTISKGWNRITIHLALREVV